MANSHFDIMFLVTACVLVVINMLVLLNMATRTRWCSIVKLILRRIRNARLMDPTKDVMETRVQQEVRARRTARAKTVTAISAGVVPCFLLSAILTCAVGGERDMTQNQDIILLGICFLLALLSACPFLVNAKTLDTWYFVLMGGMCLLCSPVGMEANGIREWAGNLVMMQLGFALFNLRTKSILIANVFVFLTSSCTYIHYEAENPRRYMIDVGLACTAFVGLMAAFQHCLESMVRHKVEMEGSQSMLSAIRAVLNTICDVVMELDSELRLRDHVPQLADLLLLNPSLSLRATSLSSYIPSEEDRQEFERHMQAGLAGSSIADAFHTRMRDTTGSTVCMEIFSVKLLGPDLRPCYILGMREFTDVPPVMKQVVEHTPRRWRSSYVHETSRHGTPPTVERLEFQTTSKESSSVPSRGSGSKSPRSESARIGSADASTKPVTDKPTTDRAMYLTLLYSMTTWRSYARLCCPKHAAAEDALRIARMFLDERCSPHFLGRVDWQCLTCGTLDDDFRQGQREDCTLCCKWSGKDKAAATEGSENAK